MKIILPVAGKGTRLRPHTFSKPKSLVKVAGNTVLYHIVDSLRKVEGAEFVFIVDKDNKVYIEEYIRRKFDMAAQYFIQEERLGPAHAVWLAKPAINEGDDMLIVFNDTIAITDYAKLTGLSEGYDGLLYVHQTETPERFGIVELTDNEVIKQIVEKPKEFIGDLAVVGAYYFKDAMRFMNACDQMIVNNEMEKGEYYMNFAIHKLIAEGAKLKSHPVEKWLDCGKPETLLETNRELLELHHGQAIENDASLIIPPVCIPDSATVKNCLIGPYVSIGENAFIEGCKIENSIIDDNAHIEGINLKESIIGQNAIVKGSARKLNIGDNSEVDFRK
ncbi:NTP transferase domain-containing protein [Candidatus Woesearchaeota archaeon]|nr:NTP transferase domain-containing protein [Candidatus Woesearchaeota archaeon]